MWIGHRKGIRKLTLRALAFRPRESRNCGLCVVCIQKGGATLLVSAWYHLLFYSLNLVSMLKKPLASSEKCVKYSFTDHSTSAATSYSRKDGVQLSSKKESLLNEGGLPQSLKTKDNSTWLKQKYKNCLFLHKNEEVDKNRN